MATIVKLSSGNYRIQVRRKGQYASKTFRRKADAYAWALEAEQRSDQGRVIKTPKITGRVQRFVGKHQVHLVN